MTKKFNQYLGKAGHLFVMSEFLIRGWNVAIPEVDVGDDIFVVQDHNGTLRRVQVKTSTSTTHRATFSGRFGASIKNLRSITTSFVYYIFVVRHRDGWSKPVIIRQDYLLDHFENNKVGTACNGNVLFYFSYAAGMVTCAGQNLTKYVQDYTDFPLLQH